MFVVSPASLIILKNKLRSLRSITIRLLMLSPPITSSVPSPSSDVGREGVLWGRHEHSDDNQPVDNQEGHHFEFAVLLANLAVGVEGQRASEVLTMPLRYPPLRLVHLADFGVGEWSSSELSSPWDFMSVNLVSSVIIEPLLVLMSSLGLPRLQVSVSAESCLQDAVCGLS